MKNFEDVFACYPQATEIYVVGNMPFVIGQHAANFAASTGQKVETINRPGKVKAELPPPEGPQTEGEEPAKVSKKGKAKG